MAFEDWLKKNDVSYETDTVFGKSDKYDFLINGVKIDIKTATRLKPMRSLEVDFDFLIARQQINNGHADIYVQLVVHKEHVYVIGFIDSFKAKQYDVSGARLVNKAHRIPIASLSKGSDLLDYLKKGK